jgi:DNA-binding GntR family transcriptional regulator
MSFRLSEGNPRGQRHSLPLHVDVLNAVRAGDPARARAAMLVLLAGAQNDVAAVMGITPKGGGPARTRNEFMPSAARRKGRARS